MSAKKPIFVIQKHDASHLHYDFRIEVDGVLVSWAVPKGPSRDPRDKRLAMPTEDHDLTWAQFEGVIPEGEYGAGTVMIWDRGTYKNIKEKEGELVPLSDCLKRGTVEIFLEGKKLHGGYALIRMEDGKRWLLIKMHAPHEHAPHEHASHEYALHEHDAYASQSEHAPKDWDYSVVTGRSMEEIAHGAQGKL